MEMDALLGALGAGNTTDLHLVSGQPPFLRIQGRLQRQGDEAITAADLETAVSALLPPEQGGQLAGLAVGTVLETTARLNGGRPYRLRVFREHGGLSATLRWMPVEIPGLEDLPYTEPEAEVLNRLIQSRSGLIVVTGPSGCGKTTTLFALAETINRTQEKRIVTLEDPIESEFVGKRSLVTQRGVGRDIREFPAGLRAVSHDDVDVVLIGDMRDLETLHLALNLAEAGHLILTQLHMQTASAAVRRLVEAFPDSQQGTIQRSLSRNLLAVIAQKLLPRADRPGRVPANEILVASPRVRALIAEGQKDLGVAIEAGRAEGMQTMDDSLMRLYGEGRISRDTAWEHLEDKGRLPRLGEEG